MADSRDFQGVNKFLIVKKMLDSGQDYGTVVATVAQLWNITPRQAEQQMAAAGYSRVKAAQSRPSTVKPVKQDAAQAAATDTKKAPARTNLKWTSQMDYNLLDWYKSGVSTKEMAKRLGGSEDAIRSRLRLVRSRQQRPVNNKPLPQQPPRQQPQQPEPPPRNNKSIPPRAGREKFHFGRELRSAALWNFGLIGQQIDAWLRRREAEKAKEEGVETGRADRQGGGGSSKRIVEQITVAATRGAAEIARRIVLMGEQVGAALEAATAAARSLTHGSGPAAASKDPAAGNAGTTRKGPGLLGLGAGIAAGGMLLASRSAKASLPPSNQRVEDVNTAVPHDEEDNLRKGAEKDKDTKQLNPVDIEAKDVEFKADKIEFDATSITGLGGQGGSGESGGGGKQKASGSVDPSSTEGPQRPPDGAIGNPAGDPSGGPGGPPDVTGAPPAASDRAPGTKQSGPGPSGPASNPMGGLQGMNGDGNTYLAGERSRFKEEFAKNPELRLRAAAITSLENEGAGPGVMESLMNRMNLPGLKGKSIEAGMASGPKSFYGPGRTGQVERRMEELRNNPKWFEKLDAHTNTALGGSNVTKGYTDQGSAGDPNYDAGGVGVNINRERFNDYNGPGGHAASQRYREHQQAEAAKAYAAANAEKAVGGVVNNAEKAVGGIPNSPVGEIGNPAGDLGGVASVLNGNAEEKAAADASPAQSSVNVMPGNPAGDATKQADTDIEIVDPTGPTFGSGKSPVPGLDTDLGGPFG